MKKLIVPLTFLMLASCGSLPKSGQQAALYDLGLPAKTAPLSLPIRLTGVHAAPGLEGSEMRYRLAYKNPAQVFAYAESRWAAAPDKLLSRRIEQRLQTTGLAPCTLQLTVIAFDQVFDAPASSRGMVQLRATLVKGVGRQAAVQTMQANAERAAVSADAQGGVAALDGASEEAITEVLKWAGAQDCK
jgi:ABC-type uncharacterized transport system auxiliary subunit